MNKNNKRALYIYGPTASGKTGFAERLASLIPAEIVNMDSTQVYAPLTIGTAKTGWQSTPFEQHLFDIMDEPTHLTAHAYRMLAEEKINEITARNRLPIFVGGSGFYLKSLFFALKSPVGAAVQEDKRADMPNDPWRYLQTIDPVRAKQIHPNDTYRINRALEIWHTTGIKPSLYKPEYNPIAPWLIVHVTRERNVLYKSIDQRVQEMIDAGWLDEVKQLVQNGWEPFLQEKGIIGYPELIAHLQHHADLQQAIMSIQQQTRNYAKRQETFWRMLKKDIEQAHFSQQTIYGKIIEFDLTYPDIDLYIKQLLGDVSTFLRGDT
jgi:tRNA dimethylallyltransferase